DSVRDVRVARVQRQRFACAETVVHHRGAAGDSGDRRAARGDAERTGVSVALIDDHDLRCELGVHAVLPVPGDRLDGQIGTRGRPGPGQLIVVLTRLADCAAAVRDD